MIATAIASADHHSNRLRPPGRAARPAAATARRRGERLRAAVGALAGLLGGLLVAHGLAPSAQAGEEFPGGDHTRYLLFMTGPHDGISPARPERITPSAFERITGHFDDLPPSRVEIGLSMIVSYFQHSGERTAQAVRRFLEAAEATGTPVTIKLDGENWWNNRPDLWNWWDPEMPGYDPDNARNVEWSGWGPEHAVKIGWRNWGRQLRVRPAPNLMSPEYQQACREAMLPLLGIIHQWWRELPPARRDLLVAVEVGWESAIGVNAYYYENGNQLLEADPADDPKTKPDRRGDLLGRGRVPLGYAAVSTAGIRDSGELRYEDQVEVVRRHLEYQSRIVREAGFPRERVFTHGWGNEDGEPLYDAALNEYASPGWSCYWYSNRLHQDTGINRGIDRSDAPYWAAVEWLFLHRFDRRAWFEAFDETLSHRDCRYLTFYNWRRISSSDNGDQIIAAARDLLAKYSLADERRELLP